MLGSRSFWRFRRSSSSSARTLPQPLPTTLITSLPNATRSSPSALRAAIREQEAKALGELNECLAILVAIFPDVQPQVFREMLQTFSEESRLELITEAMLKHKVKWVRGRWRVPEKTPSSTSTKGSGNDFDGIPVQEQFRTIEYKNAVKLALCDEFKDLGRASIKAVLAEHNYSYMEARQALLEVVSTSWRFAVFNFLFRRKTPVAEEHPLLQWKWNERGARRPHLVPTGSEELDQELEKALLAPMLEDIAEKVMVVDRALAIKLNEAEAEAAEATFDCECCFTSSTFEEIAACDTGNHFICFRCLRHTMNEALYGQGWAKTFDATKCTLKCIAISTDSNTCSGCMRFDLVERAVMAEPKGDETIRKFHQRAINDGLQKSQLRIRQCPSCSYAEAEDPPKEPSPHEALLTTAIMVIASLLTIAIFSFDLNLTQLILTHSFLFLTLHHLSTHIDLTHLSPTPQPTPLPNPNPNNGTKFICRSPLCLHTTCLRCAALWTDPHTCFTSTRLALRTYVDSAISTAIKRTCPQCNLSFIKSSGCNKLVCVCGYAMCYICRADVGREGYLHFCQHFRAEPGKRCGECERCDLYRDEEEEEVIRRARRRAVGEWREMQRQGRVGVGVGAEGLDEVEKEVLGGEGGGVMW